MQGWNLMNSYGDLPPLFYSREGPTAVAFPELVVLNRPLGESLGFDMDSFSARDLAIFAGNELPPGSVPLAQAYAGHQYGNFTTLGDGRAILLGEQVTPGGGLNDIQLKGSGPTRYSRRGDGRASLAPMLREYLISEAMGALGIPTTRSLAVVKTGEKILRHDGWQPGAVLTRVAASHIRVGTFEWASGAGGVAALGAITDYTLERHFPERMDQGNRAFALLEGVVERQADLIAKWMLVGFVHGVMNTDNMALSGETIDYGPCAFMDGYDPATVFSSIDRGGRYSYGNQPFIAQWNLARFAETLLPLLHEKEEPAIEMAMGVIQGFSERYRRTWQEGMRRKLGIFEEEAGDVQLIDDLLEWMAAGKRDFTNTFSSLSHASESVVSPAADVKFSEWAERWRARLARQSQTEEESRSLRAASNPVVIPRNHRVEEALAAAADGDLSPLTRLLSVLAKPHDPAADEAYRQPGSEESGRYVTYCGT